MFSISCLWHRNDFISMMIMIIIMSMMWDDTFNDTSMEVIWWDETSRVEVRWDNMRFNHIYTITCMFVEVYRHRIICIFSLNACVPPPLKPPSCTGIGRIFGQGEVGIIMGKLCTLRMRRQKSLLWLTSQRWRWKPGWMPTHGSHLFNCSGRG